MQSKATTVEEYIEALSEDKNLIISKIRGILKENMPVDFHEEMSYGMIGYVVPHGIYPAGYHCSPKLPLPFISIASQKNFIALYHMAVAYDDDLLTWFKESYQTHCKTKLDMGVGCIRFKKMDDIPYDLIGELASKMTVAAWIELYERKVKKK